MQEGGAPNWISGGVAVALVLVSVVSMLAFLALSAYAPQLRDETAGRPNVLSKSAVGFAGLRVMLEESGKSVSVSRSRDVEGDTLLVLTPDGTTSGQTVAALTAHGGPVLIVLPKWAPMPDYLHAGWVRKFTTENPDQVAAALKGLDGSSLIAQAGAEAKKAKADPKAKAKPGKPMLPPPEKPVAVTLVGTPDFGTSPYPTTKIEALQTVSGAKWVPQLTDGHGHAVLARLKGSKVYVLADPDFLNTAALRDETVAAGALALIARLPGTPRAIVFDVTLAGFDTPPSLIHAVFGPPFLAVTLAALLAAGLLGFRAMHRFGSPRRSERTFAFGKRSLADNTAGLIRAMNRLPGMMPRYAAAQRRLAAKTLRGGASEDADWIDGVERAGRIAPTYAELLAEADGIKSEPALMTFAAKLHDWKSRIIHERF